MHVILQGKHFVGFFKKRRLQRRSVLVCPPTFYSFLKSSINSLKLLIYLFTKCIGPEVPKPETAYDKIEIFKLCGCS